MVESKLGVRDVAALRVPLVGVVQQDAVAGWVITDASGAAVEVVARYLVEVRATGCSSLTQRSYAHDLLRWWRFLSAIDVPWAEALRPEVRDFVRWMQVADNRQRTRSATRGRPAPGTTNPVTHKSYLRRGYAPRTINHALTVVASFYDFAMDAGLGPLVNPVPGQRRTLDSPQPATRRRTRYRQRTPDPQPRGMSEELMQQLFVKLGNDRDRALVAVALSSGARAGELLSMTRGGVDAGAGVLCIKPKGYGGATMWIPAAPESFVWITRYLTAVPMSSQDNGHDPALWMTLRSPHRPLNYMALRQILERANCHLGTNLTWHDLRHTFTHRLLEDPSLSLTDVQHLVRHQNISTLATYSASRLDELVTHLHAHLNRPPTPPPVAAIGYAAEDLAILFPELS